MKKRSKYRPRPLILDPMTYVKSGMKKVGSISAGTDLMIKNHMALDNIRERLALLYDMEAQLATNVVDGKFEVRVYLPYQKVAV